MLEVGSAMLFSLYGVAAFFIMALGIPVIFSVILAIVVSIGIRNSTGGDFDKLKNTLDGIIKGVALFLMVGGIYLIMDGGMLLCMFSIMLLMIRVL